MKTTEIHLVKLNGVVVTHTIETQLNIRDMIDVCRFILEDNNPKYIECRFCAYGSIYRIENPFVYQVEK